MDQSPTLSQESSKTPSAKQPIVRKWLWIVLGAIIIIALIVVGITRATGDKSNSSIAATPKSSPKVSPTAATSPSTSPSAASQTNTQANNSTSSTNDQSSNATNKTWSGEIDAAHSASCIPRISFSYPSNLYANNFQHSPTNIGYTYISATDDYSNNDRITISPVSAEISGNPPTSITCVRQSLDTLYQRYKTEYLSSTPQGVVSDPKYISYPSSAAGQSALQFSEDSKLITLIDNGGSFIVSVSNSTPSLSEAYNTIINSFEFR